MQQKFPENFYSFRSTALVVDQQSPDQALNSQHPAGDDPARRFAETLEQVRLVRSLGFDSIWAGEHHVTPGFHFFPQLPQCAMLPD